MYQFSVYSSILRSSVARSSSSSLFSLPFPRCYGAFSHPKSQVPSLGAPDSFPTHTLPVIGCVESVSGGSHSSENVARKEIAKHVWGFSGASGLSFGSMNDVKGNVSAPYVLSFRSYIHSSSRTDFETERNSRSMNFARGNDFETERNSRSMNFARGNDFETERNSRSMNFARGSDFETERNSRSMNFVRGIIEEDGRDVIGRSQLSRYNVEQNADIVHIKLLRNNTFITVTDSKGNTKLWSSAGCLQARQGGAKLSRYAAEATAEHVGRRSRDLGLKSVVMKVNGFTYFKKKRLAIMSWREGFTGSRGDQNPIVYIEDTTRRPHNGCRLPKKRRI